MRSEAREGIVVVGVGMALMIENDPRDRGLGPDGDLCDRAPNRCGRRVATRSISSFAVSLSRYFPSSSRMPMQAGPARS